MLMMKAAIDNF